MLGWDLRLRLQEDYKRLRAWTGSEASGFISFPGSQKPDWKTRLWWRHGRRGTMVMLGFEASTTRGLQEASCLGGI